MPVTEGSGNGSTGFRGIDPQVAAAMRRSQQESYVRTTASASQQTKDLMRSMVQHQLDAMKYAELQASENAARAAAAEARANAAEAREKRNARWNKAGVLLALVAAVASIVMPFAVR